MKQVIDAIVGTQDYGVVIAGAVFVLVGVLLRTLYNFSRNIKSKDKPAQWWSKKFFAFFLGCLLMRFLSVFIAVENADFGFVVGAVFGFFPEVAIHYWFEAKNRMRNEKKFKDRQQG